VRILLDTHVFLWAVTDDARLTTAHRTQYVDEANDFYLSVASVWEIVIKAGLGKLPIPSPTTEYVQRQMEKNRVTLLGIQARHLARLEGLAPVHRDPFDRMIVAQALAENMPMMTVDPAVAHYGVEVL
jgi:PIN domain nuclease of toxin-antitoxin system